MAKNPDNLNPVEKLPASGAHPSDQTGGEYAGPMYDENTGFMDSSQNMGPVHGPTYGGEVPDPIGYGSKLNRKKAGGQK